VEATSATLQLKISSAVRVTRTLVMVRRSASSIRNPVLLVMCSLSATQNVAAYMIGMPHG
jgi:hypothetical protein